MNDWQPRSTAPKDGTRALFIQENGTMKVDRWVKGKCHDRFWEEEGWANARYTHWMPLPAPPVRDAK